MTTDPTRRDRILTRAARAAASGRAGQWLKLHMLAAEEKTIKDAPDGRPD